MLGGLAYIGAVTLKVVAHWIVQEIVKSLALVLLFRERSRGARAKNGMSIFEYTKKTDNIGRSCPRFSEA